MGWISDLLGFSIPSIWGYVAAGLGILATLFGTYFKGGRDKARKLELKHKEELVKRDKETMNVIRETQRSLDRLGADDIVDRLRRNDGDWSRM